MFKTPYASQWLSLKLFPYCSSRSPCFATLTFLLHPPTCPSLRVFALAILFCLKLFPQTATVCSLTSVRSLFKYFLIREAIPISQYKRARNDSNRPYHFPPLLTTWDIYSSIAYLSLLEC